MANPAFDPETLAIGTVGRPHGLGGELTLRPHNTSATAPSALGAAVGAGLGAGAGAAGAGRISRVWLEKEGLRREWRVEALRRAGPVWIFRLAGIDSRESADTLTNAVVRIARSALPALGEGEFFVEDLVGCAVVNDDGRALGSVASLFWNGAQDIMVVRARAGGDPGGSGTRDGSGARAPRAAVDDEILIPVVPAFVRTVDTVGRRVVVEWSLETEEVRPEVRTRPDG
jgi:16S rRNA processing protein RimM